MIFFVFFLYFFLTPDGRCARLKIDKVIEAAVERYFRRGSRARENRNEMRTEREHRTRFFFFYLSVREGEG